LAAKSEKQRFAMEDAWGEAQKAASKSKAKSYEAAKAWVRRKGSVKMKAMLSGPTDNAAAREFRQSLRDLTDPEATRKMHEHHMGAGHYNPRKKRRKNAPKGGAGTGAKRFWAEQEREELTPRIKEVLQLAAGAKALSKFYSSAGKEYDYDTHKSQKYRATAKARLAEGKRMAHDEDLAQSYYHRMWKEIEHKLAYRKLDPRHIENVIAQTGRKLASKQKPRRNRSRYRRPMPARCPFTGQFMSSQSRRHR
jgi:hypothetical protein